MKLTSSDGVRNLSDEAYAAFKEPGTEARVSVLSGQTRVVRADGSTDPVIVGAQIDHDATDIPEETVVILRPHVRARRKRPTNVTVKENLSPAEVAEMLGDQSDWKLAVPNETTTNVLTKQLLKDAWEEQASGVVTQTLRDATVGEQAVLDDARERLSPKGGAARITSAVGSPVTNIALLAAAFGGFLGWKGGEVARTYFLVIAVILALLSVILSLVATNFLRKTTVRLSRLDLLQNQSLGPSPWVTNLCSLLFIAAMIAAVFSVFPAKSSAAPSASFSKPATSKTGDRTKVSFTVKWKSLGSDAEKASISVRTAGRTLKEDVVPKQSDGTASREISITVRAPATLEVSTQALDAKGQPVGDKVGHTYKVP